MNKLKCLFVGVYEEMYNSYLEIKDKYSDIILDYVLYKDELEIDLDSYDFIISRGGVSTRLKALTNVKVFDFGISIYDILNTIDLSKLNETLLIGFAGITEAAILLKKYTSYNINIITISSHEEINKYIKEINKYKYIYCGYNTYNTVKLLNTSTALIKSSTDTILSTLARAISFTKAIKEEKLKELILKASLANDSTNVIIYDNNRNIIHKIITNNEDIELINTTIEKNLKAFIKNKNKRIVVNTSKSYIEIANAHFTIENKIYTSIKITYHNSLSKTNYIYQALDKNLFKDYSLNIDIKEEISSYSTNNIPLVIYTNPGSITSLVIDLIINSSIYKDNTSFEISFNGLSKSSFNNLLKDDSILLLEGHVIILKDLEYLDNISLNNLFKFLKEINITRNNKLILSTAYSSKLRLNSYLNQLPYYLITLKPFDENINKKEIIDEYIKALNIDINESDKELLYDFSYYENELQLIRILNQIKASNLKLLPSILEKEKNSTINNDTYKNKSLENIILEAIHYNLNITNNNQLQASKKLGISRQTMWRYLKK